MLKTNNKVIKKVSSLPSTGDTNSIYYNTTDGFYYGWNSVTNQFDNLSQGGESVSVYIQSSSTTKPSPAVESDTLIITDNGLATGTITEQWIYSGSTWIQMPNDKVLDVLTTSQTPPNLSGTNTTNLGKIFKGTDDFSYIVDYSGEAIRVGTTIVGDRYKTTSTTCNNIVSTGNLTFTVETGLAYTPLQDIIVYSDAANHMNGEVVSYNSATGVLVIKVHHKTGSGNFCNWTLNLDAIKLAEVSVYFGSQDPITAGQTGIEGDLFYRTSNGSNTGTVLETWVYDGTTWVKVDTQPKPFAQVVYFNGTNPTTATIFDLNNPPTTNNNALKLLDNAIYIGTDESTWNSDGTTYSTYVVPPSTEWNLAGTLIDAGANKNDAIYRRGFVGFSNFDNFVPVAPVDVTTQGQVNATAYISVDGVNNGNQVVVNLGTRRGTGTFGNGSNKGWQIGARSDSWNQGGTQEANLMFLSFWNGVNFTQLAKFAPNGNVCLGASAYNFIPQFTLDVQGTARILTTPTITTATKMLVKDPTTGQVSEQNIFPITTSLTAQYGNGTTHVNAQANAVGTVADVIRLSDGTLVNNEDVVTWTGHGLQLHAWYFLSPTTAGGYTIVPPIAPNYSQRLFYVVDANTVKINVQEAQMVSGSATYAPEIRGNATGAAVTTHNALVDVDGASITLQPGTYQIGYNVHGSLTNNSNGVMTMFSRLSTGANVDVDGSNRIIVSATPVSGFSASFGGSASFETAPITITTVTTYKIRMIKWTEAGTPNTGQNMSINYGSYIYAKRII